MMASTILAPEFFGYAVTDLQAHYDVTKRFRLALQVDNVFDHHYYTAGQLANTGFNAQGSDDLKTSAARISSAGDAAIAAFFLFFFVVAPLPCAVGFPPGVPNAE